MSETTILILRIAGLVIAAAGIAIIFSARKIVEIKNLAEKRQDDSNLPETMTKEEKARLRLDRAILDVKLRGMLIAAPGFILILIGFA
jgi:hypothetical protein